LPLSDPVGLHVGSCSECYAEYRHYRLDWMESGEATPVAVVTSVEVTDAVERSNRPIYGWPPSRSMSAILAIAASVLIGLVALEAHRSRRRDSDGAVRTASAAPVSASMNLFDVPALRGVENDSAPLQEVSLPAALVHLSITLPRFSEDGPYRIVISRDRAGSQLVARGSGTAIESNGKVGLDVTLDLRSAKAGAYFLATIRGSDNGVYYYPLKVD